MKYILQLILLIPLLAYSQSVVILKNYPINKSPNPTLIAYDYTSGESKSFWNDFNNQEFLIDSNEKLFTNLIINGFSDKSKTLFIRNKDTIIIDHNSQEIRSLNYFYNEDDFRLLKISNDLRCEKEACVDSIAKNWKVSQDFYSIIQIQQAIATLKMEGISEEVPKGLPMYRSKVYEYIGRNYTIKEKKGKGNQRYLDYLEYLTEIYQDSLINKEVLLQFTFANLNAMASSTSKEDFKSAFNLFKENSKDKNAIEYIQNEYFLDENIIDKSELGIVNYNRQLVKLDHIKKQNSGKFLIIDLWASWCGPCLISLPKSLEIANKYKKEVSVIYLSLDKNYNPWYNSSVDFELLEKESYLIVNGSSADLQIDNIKIKEIPRYLIYDRSGKIVQSEFTDIKDVESFINTILFN